MVITRFFVIKPIINAIKIETTLGSLNSTKVPLLSKKTAGKIIAGNTADGTKFNTCFVFFPIFLD